MFKKKSGNGPSRQRRRARILAQSQKDAEEVFCSECKGTKTDENVNEAEVASKEECETVILIKPMMKLKRLKKLLKTIHLIVSCAKLVVMKVKQQKI